VAILQRLGLVDQVLPLSNFYIKVRLVTDVTDEIFVQKIISYNRTINEQLFHSISDGETTVSLYPPRYGSLKAPPSTKHFLVVDCPPCGLEKGQIEDWLRDTQEAYDVSVRWAEGPNGSCVVVECAFPDKKPFPVFFQFGAKKYKIQNYAYLPPDYRFVEKDPAFFQNSLLACFTDLQGASFPEHLETAILSLLGESDAPSSTSSSSKRISSSSSSSSSSTSSANTARDTY
jgi:hypothetical protein